MNDLNIARFGSCDHFSRSSRSFDLEPEPEERVLEMVPVLASVEETKGERRTPVHKEAVGEKDEENGNDNEAQEFGQEQQLARLHSLLKKKTKGAGETEKGRNASTTKAVKATSSGLPQHHNVAENSECGNYAEDSQCNERRRRRQRRDTTPNPLAARDRRRRWALAGEAKKRQPHVYLGWGICEFVSESIRLILRLFSISCNRKRGKVTHRYENL